MLQELKKITKEMHKIDVIVVRDFNKDVSAKSMKEFIIETGSHEDFSEFNDDEVNNRDGTFEHRSKCIDFVLVFEAFLVLLKESN